LPRILDKDVQQRIQRGAGAAAPATS